jgi:hypothetical protein
MKEAGNHPPTGLFVRQRFAFAKRTGYRNKNNNISPINLAADTRRPELPAMYWYSGRYCLLFHLRSKRTGRRDIGLKIWSR